MIVRPLLRDQRDHAQGRVMVSACGPRPSLPPCPVATGASPRGYPAQSV